MLHYGDPDWYERYVGPLRAAYRQDSKPQVSFHLSHLSRLHRDSVGID